MASKHHKVVIRHLPPDLPETIFWKTVDPLLVNNGQDAWRCYCLGKLRTESNKDNVFSRAYIEFTDDDVMINFSKAFDGHLFVDKKGRKFQARIEMAPFPRIPPNKAKRKLDPRQGTIDTDADYLAFIENLKKPIEPLTVTPTVESKAKLTPLLEHLRKQKESKATRASEKATAHAPKASTSRTLPSTSGAAPSKANEQADASKEGTGKAKRKKPVKSKEAIPASPSASQNNEISASQVTTVTTDIATPKEKRPKPPRGPRKEDAKGAGDVSRRLMGGTILGPAGQGSGGGRLAARRAEEKAAKQQQESQERAGDLVTPSIQAQEASTSLHRGGPSRGRGRGRGRGAMPVGTT